MSNSENSIQHASGVSPDHRIRGSLYQAILKMRSSGALQKLAFLETQQWVSREESAISQRRRLRALLRHAVKHVPYYRKILPTIGIINESAEIDLDKFSDIPLLDKRTIHDRFDDLKSDDHNQRKWIRRSSGGSTGETVHVIQDQEYAEWDRAVGILFDRWARYYLGDPKLLIWSSVDDIHGRYADLRRSVGSIARNEKWIDARSISQREMRAVLSRIQSSKPKMIFGFPENVYDLARLALDEGYSLNSPGSIVSSGAALYPWMRSVIEAAHGAPIFNRYGSHEAAGIACECEAHMGLHVCVPLQYVEIIRPDGTYTDPGEIGEVVITNLVNHVMPLIRYRIGDMAAWRDVECECGRPWPMLKDVAGRTRDLFMKRDGTRIRIWEHVFHQHAWIRKFQIVQEEFEIVQAYIVPHDDAEEPARIHANEIQQIENDIREVMGAECSVTVSLTDHIDASPSGKYRNHISLVG